MEAKELIFTIGSLFCVPTGVLLARSHPRILGLVFFALVFGTTQTESLFGLPTDINFLSREWYRGTTRGIEVSYLDLLALILLFASLSTRRRERIPFVRPPSLGMLVAFFAWAAFNVLVTSDPKIFGLFELTKIARGILLFTAVAAYVRSPREVRLFVWTLVIVMFYETAVALQDRYIFGIHRISGTLPHPNSLSMYCLQILPILISVWFARDISPNLKKASLAASLAAAVSIILTISRTGIASLIFLMMVSLVLNIRFRFTIRNIGLAALLALAGTGMLVKSWDTVLTRFASFDFQQEYTTEQGDRGSYFRKGLPALNDNPVFGVGLNNWSYWISNRYAAKAGYESEPYPSAEFAPDAIGQEAPAHNLYLITAVELGWPGLLLLLALISRWLYISGKGLTSASETLIDRVRLGACLSLCGVLMQSVTEWEFRQSSLFFLGHIVMAVAAVIYYHTKRNPRA
ncbi:MAG: O-antigen ligase family protein [Gammaproteobacteria bacterium]|nr:O-antigen ligase family protein [Gammaproteobacteria bacterium]